MNITKFLTASNFAANVNCVSKKSALENVCLLATQGISSIKQKDALNALIEREKLGSTAIGYGVALPHARLDGIDRPLAALIHLTSPINFDSPDDEPVDLLFGLLIPVENTDEHLKILSKLAELFSIKSFREQLRNAKTNEDLFQIMTGKAV